MLKANNERQRDSLLGFVARLRSRSLVADPLVENVGVWFKPDGLVPACRPRQLGHPLVLRAAPVSPQRVQRAIGGDPVQPGTNRRASLDCANPRQAASSVSWSKS